MAFVFLLILTDTKLLSYSVYDMIRFSCMRSCRPSFHSLSTEALFQIYATQNFYLEHCRFIGEFLYLDGAVHVQYDEYAQIGSFIVFVFFFF